MFRIIAKHIKKLFFLGCVAEIGFSSNQSFGFGVKFEDNQRVFLFNISFSV